MGSARSVAPLGFHFRNNPSSETFGAASRQPIGILALHTDSTRHTTLARRPRPPGRRSFHEVSELGADAQVVAVGPNVDPRPLRGLSIADLALAVAGFAGCLLAATVASAVAAHDRSQLVPSILAYASTAGLAAAATMLVAPVLAAAAVVVLPAALLSTWLVRSRRNRSLPASLAAATQAAVLAPSAASVYLFGSVLTVRSVIRERGNDSFWAVSIATQAAAALLALVVLSLAAAGLLFAFAVRVWLAPWLVRILTARARAFRPVFLGLEETIAGMALVLVVLLARL